MDAVTHKEQIQLTSEAATGTVRLNLMPEFCDSKTLHGLTGLSRSHAYALLAEGKIRSACIRKPGSARGKRLWNLASVSSFLNSQMEVGK